MTGASTSDPLVALVYGALTYPSLRPGVTTTADLVAGQPGPWTLSDPDLAEQAHDIVNRLRLPVPAFDAADAVRPLAEALAPLPTLETALRRARTALAAPELDLPQVLQHQVLALDDRLAGLLGSLADLVPAPTTAERHMADLGEVFEPDDERVPVLPEAAAIEWRPDEWMLMIRGAGLSVPDVLKALRVDDDAHGRVRTARLREVTGHVERTRFLLDHLAAHRTPGSAR